MFSESVQDYLKAIYHLHWEDGRVTTSALAAYLNVSAASVTGMLKKLAELGLVTYEPYQGAVLTPAGEKAALEVIRHHRLIELYLTKAMGYSWDQVHAEAERLEHVISEDFEERMATLLGDPAFDPHGDPIPTRSGQVASSSRRTLAEADEGSLVCVERIRDEDPDLLREVAGLGLWPRTRLLIGARAADASLTVYFPSGQSCSVSARVASSIFVVDP